MAKKRRKQAAIRGDEDGPATAGGGRRRHEAKRVGVDAESADDGVRDRRGGCDGRLRSGESTALGLVAAGAGEDGR